MTIFIIRSIKIRSYEMGLYFRDGEFKGLLREGRHWFVDPLGKVKIEVVSQRQPWLQHEKLDVISRSGALKNRAVLLDLKDYERALVRIDAAHHVQTHGNETPTGNAAVGPTEFTGTTWNSWVYSGICG